MSDPKTAADQLVKEARIAQEKQLNRVTMLQIITSKIEKVFAGKHYSLDLIISALVIILAKAIAAGPRDQHGTMLAQAGTALVHAVQATYPDLPTQVKGSDGSTPDKPTDANGVVGAEASKTVN